VLSRQGMYSNYYCETEPSFQNLSKNLLNDNKNAPFKDEDFEKVVEFSEDEEEDKIINQNDDILQLCDEIQEVSDESLQ
jgi:hypothetical protein